jgi:DNA-binding response OmpR family regulator
MRNGEKSRIILVAAKEDLHNNLRDALKETDLALLHAQNQREAIVLLERLRTEIDLAIIELELPDSGGWELIGKLRRHSDNPVKIIATTSRYPGPVLTKVIDLGVDAIVQEATSPEEWRKTVETVLYSKACLEPARE